MSKRPDPRDLIAEHAGFVRGLARRLVHDPGSAQDAEQETWLAAVTSPPEDGDRARPWLARVLKNAVRQQHRRRGRRHRREQAAARSDRVMSAAERSARAEIMRRVTDAVLSLDAIYRDVVLLRFYEDLPPREIARRLDLPVETVRTRVKRALARLRTDLDDRHGGDRRRWLAALVPLAGPPPATPTPPVPASRAVLAGAALVGAAAVALLVGRAGGGNGEGEPARGTTATRAASPELAGRSRPPSGTAPRPAVPTGQRARYVTGRVLDVRGTPVARASVEIHPGRLPSPDRPMDPLRLHALMTSEAVPVAAGSTDDDGRFRLGALETGPWSLIVRASGHQLTVQRVVLTPEGLAGPPLVMRLVPRPPLRGRVVDAAGRGIAAARVAVLAQVRTAAGVYARRFVTTADDGTFAVRSPPPPGPVQLVVSAEGRPTRLQGPVHAQTPLRIVLPPPTSLRMRVRDPQGVPLADARVELVVGSQAPGGLLDLAQGRTDRAGETVLHARPGRILAVLLSHPAEGLAFTAPDRPAGMGSLLEVSGWAEDGRLAADETWTIRLREPAQLHGRVQDEAGRPVAGVEVRALGPAGPGAQATSGVDGHYTLPLVPATPAMVVARMPGRIQLDSTVRVDGTAGSGRRIEHDVVMVPAVTVRGRIVDGRGRPLVGADVRLLGTDPANFDGPPHAASTTSEADGSYRFETVRPGRRLRVHATLRGHGSASSPPFEPTEATDVHLDDLAVPRGRVLDVEVYGPGGPLVGAWILPKPVRDTPSPALDEAALGHLVTDARGRARTPPLTSEAWWLVVDAPGHAARRVRLDPSEAPDPVHVRLEPGRTITGGVRDADGRPLAGALVLLHLEADGWRPPAGAVTDAQGRFTLEDLPPDEPLRIAVRAPGHETAVLDAAAFARADGAVRLHRAKPGASRSPKELRADLLRLEHRWRTTQDARERRLLERRIQDLIGLLRAAPAPEGDAR